MSKWRFGKWERGDDEEWRHPQCSDWDWEWELNVLLDRQEEMAEMIERLCSCAERARATLQDYARREGTNDINRHANWEYLDTTIERDFLETIRAPQEEARAAPPKRRTKLEVPELMTDGHGTLDITKHLSDIRTIAAAVRELCVAVNEMNRLMNPESDAVELRQCRNPDMWR